MKILYIFFLLNYNITQDRSEDYIIFQELIHNLIKYEKTDSLFNDFNHYFSKIANKFIEEKVSGITSYNMKIIGNLLLKKNKYFNKLNFINQIKFKDSFNLYYISGVENPKYQNLIIQSKKKHDFLTVINKSLADSIEINLKKNTLKINNNNFKLIDLSLQKNNPEIAQLYKNYLGNTECNIRITAMESFFIKKSLEDEFYRKYDDNLRKIDLYLYLYYRGEQIFEEGQFFLLKKLIMDNFVRKKNLDFNNAYGENVHHYFFNSKDQDLDKNFKKKFLKYFSSREILIATYNYVY
jgi:hypothetical protein